MATPPTSDFTFRATSGAPVTFTGNQSPPLFDPTAEMRNAVVVVEELRAALAKARADVMAAEAAKAAAEKAERVARSCFLASKKMDASDYNALVDLQQRVDRLEAFNKDAREQIAEEEKRVKGLYEDIAFKDRQVATLTTDKTNLTNSLQATKQDLAHRVKATEEIDKHLDNAYADFEREKSAHKATLKAKDDLEAQHKAVQLELQHLHGQWEEAQSKISEVESQIARMDELDRDNHGLQTDLDNLRKELGDHERTVLVKDERLQYLEDQYQKALAGRLRAEAAASATSATIAGDETLKDELAAVDAAADDFVDDGSAWEQFEFSHITEIADIAPVEPAPVPKLTLAVVQAASIAPVAPQTTTSSTQTNGREHATSSSQTDERPISTSSTQTAELKLATASSQTEQLQISTSSTQTDASASPTSTQTDAPKLTAGIIHHATIDIAPVESDKSFTSTTVQTDDLPMDGSLTEPKMLTTTAIQTDDVVLAERNAQTSAAQTDISNPIMPYKAPTVTIATQTASIAPTPEPTVSVITRTEKKSTSSYLPYLTALLALICFMLWAQLQIWQNENGYGYHSGTGAFGNGRYLFGIFPIGFDIGHSWFSEEVCRQTSTAIAAFEDWAGITPTPLY